MSKKQNQTREASDPIVRELQLIKKLLMLQLIKQGSTSEEVNLAVGMGASNIRAMFPVKRNNAARKTEEK